jgi:hypothetical protein
MLPPPDWRTHGKLQKMSKPNLTGSSTKKSTDAPQYELPKADNSRLDAIYAQLKNLQSFKDEIMDDLNDFMDDFETQSVTKQIEKPAQFEEVVDIVVSDSRQRADDILRRQELEERA